MRRKTTKSPKWLEKIKQYAREHVLITVGGIIVLLLALLLISPWRFVLLPAIVNNKPVFGWTYFVALHRQAGPQILDQLISEKLIRQEIKKEGIVVSEEEIDAQVKEIEGQLAETEGGLDGLLAFQGMTRDQFIENLERNIAIEKLVKSTIDVTEEDVQQELEQNSDVYKDLSEDDAATSAAENIRSSKVQEAFIKWLGELRTQAKIYNFLPASSQTLNL